MGTAGQRVCRFLNGTGTGTDRIFICFLLASCPQQEYNQREKRAFRAKTGGSVMNLIETEYLTKDYGNGRGVFELNFEVQEGEVFGFLGPNGAGKTTTIRQLMGFVRPQKGSARILGKDCFRERDKIQSELGYLPGEIAFWDEMSGREFIRFIGNMKGMKDFSRAEELIRRFELNPSGKISRMSKGMKQKIGIVCAFMQNPKILILDEPTSGLDPLMQNRFIELLLEEKKKGTTIFLSSHIFEEIEKTCDRAAFIRDGRIIAVEQMEKMKKSRRKIYEISFEKEIQAQEFCRKFDGASCQGNCVTVETKELRELLFQLAQEPVTDLKIRSQSLEELFLHLYGGEKA